MLIQSQLGYTQFLPALPQAWANGSVSGLVARGNFVIDMDWKDGKAKSLSVTARSGGKFIGEYENLYKFDVTDSSGAHVPVTIISKDKIVFNTTAGETYRLVPDIALDGTHSCSTDVFGGVYYSSLQNYTDNAIKGNFIVAVYDAGNRLVYNEIKDFNVSSGDVDFAAFVIPDGYRSSGYTVKLFTWNSEFVPLGVAAAFGL